MMGYAAIERRWGVAGTAVCCSQRMPWQEAAAGLIKITHANISTDAQEAILGANLLRLIGESTS